MDTIHKDVIFISLALVIFAAMIAALWRVQSSNIISAQTFETACLWGERYVTNPRGYLTPMIDNNGRVLSCEVGERI